MSTTFRADLTTAHMAVLGAEPLLKKVYPSRPGLPAETPCAWIGSKDEQITYSTSLRTRTFNGYTIWVCDVYIDAETTADRLDAIIDSLVTRYTAAHAQVPGGGSLLKLSSVTDTDIPFAGANGIDTTYRGAVLGFGETFVTEGRN